MTLKKLTVIAIAAAVMITGAIGIAIRLTAPAEMEMKVTEHTEPEELQNGASKTIDNMENTPLYYDEEKRLLLPLRNVMEGLGATVAWNAEIRQAVVSYRGKKLAFIPGEEKAILNGYEVTLPKEAETINGCLYVDADVISAYFTDEVIWDHISRQITLKTKDHSIPLVAKNILRESVGNCVYEIEVPVITGLNDANFEKSLNEKLFRELKAFVNEISAKENGAEEEHMKLKQQIEFCTKDFLSLYWECEQEAENGTVLLGLSQNINLREQKTVVLADLLEQDSLDKITESMGAEWIETDFYVTKMGVIATFKSEAQGGMGTSFWSEDMEGERKIRLKQVFHEIFPNQATEPTL